MKNKNILLAAFLSAALLSSLSGCGSSDTSSSADSSSAQTQAETQPETQEETQHETVPPEEIGFEGMTPVTADELSDGEYPITVDSSSSMFKITECTLAVSSGSMTAKMTMSGKGYEYLYMGTEEAAASANENDFIKYEENADGAHVFTVPVEALNKEIDCAAFSKKKQQWYGRTLVFRADSLPDDAGFSNNGTSASELGLEDGEYTADVKLEGGSGRASVSSPAKLTVKDGNVTAEIIWSSNKYDYMIVGDEKYLPLSTDENSVFEIPVSGFDFMMPVKADTTAMSTPHEIEYTLYFDSASIEKK